MELGTIRPPQPSGFTGLQVKTRLGVFTEESGNGETEADFSEGDGFPVPLPATSGLGWQSCPFQQSCKYRLTSEMYDVYSIVKEPKR